MFGLFDVEPFHTVVCFVALIFVFRVLCWHGVMFSQAKSGYRSLLQHVKHTYWVHTPLLYCG